jgi:hypothetical protein
LKATEPLLLSLLAPIVHNYDHESLTTQNK